MFDSVVASDSVVIPGSIADACDRASFKSWATAGAPMSGTSQPASGSSISARVVISAAVVVKSLAASMAA